MEAHKTKDAGKELESLMDFIIDVKLWCAGNAELRIHCLGGCICIDMAAGAVCLYGKFRAERKTFC